MEEEKFTFKDYLYGVLCTLVFIGIIALYIGPTVLSLVLALEFSVWFLFLLLLNIFTIPLAILISKRHFDDGVY